MDIISRMALFLEGDLELGQIHTEHTGAQNGHRATADRRGLPGHLAQTDRVNLEKIHYLSLGIRT